MNNNQSPNQRIKKEIELKLENQEWYRALIEGCKAIVVETEFCARTELIKGKWLLGDEILDEKLNFERAGYGKKIAETVAKDLGMSPREIWRCIQFRETYPKLCHGVTEFNINQLPEGKNISWHKIINKYLPEPKSKEIEECLHFEIEEISFLKCRECGKSLEGHSRIFSKEAILNNLENWAKANNFPQFPIELGEKEKPFIYIPTGEENWKGYLKKNPFPEVWKLLKKIEDKR